MRLSPREFNRFLRHIGQQVVWRQAFDCPCRDVHSGAARHDCKHCRGRGTVWGADQPAYAGVQSMAAVKQWADFDVWESGDLMVTIPSDSPMYAAGQFDQIILTQSSEPFSLTMTRGEDDFFRWPVLSITRTFCLSDDGTTVVELTPPVVLPDGTLEWSTDDEAVVPMLGKQFSITGRDRKSVV